MNTRNPTPTLDRHVWANLAATLGIPRTASQTPISRARPPRSLHDIDTLLRTACKDGERTNHLVTLVGKLLASGEKPDAALTKCHQWNQQNTPPLDDGKIERTFQSILDLDQRNHPERYPQLQSLEPLFPLDQGRVDHYIDNQPPARRWLINDTIVLGKSGAVVAPGGSSKSQWLLQLAVSVATGLPLAGHWHVSEPGNVIMLCAEDDQDEIHRRLHRIVDHFQQESHNLDALGLKARLRVFSTIGVDTLLTKRSPSGEVSGTGIVDRIALMAEDWGNVRLIIIDPASRFRGGEENSNEDATRFVQALETLAQRTAASVLIAHHTGKASYDSTNEPSQAASRGASALTDGLRWQMNLSSPRSNQLKQIGVSKDTSAPGSYLVATVTKTNYTAYPAPVILERLGNGYLQAINADAAHQRRTLQAELRILQAIAASSKPLTARGLEDQHGGAKGQLAMPKHEVRRHVKALIQKGLLAGGDRQKLQLTSRGQGTLQAHRPATDGASPSDAEPPRKKRQ